VEFGISAVQSLGESRSLEAGLSGGAFARPGSTVAGLYDHPSPPTRGWRRSKKEDEALGRSRGGFSTKLHLACDARGQPVEVRLGPGQEHDSRQAELLVGQHQPTAVIADRAYDTDAFLNLLRQRHTEAVIPPLKNRIIQRRYNRKKYKRRNLIERLVNRLKHYRRVATRYEKTARNFLAFAHLASALVTLGVTVNTT
jgi:transposase